MKHSNGISPNNDRLTHLKRQSGEWLMRWKAIRWLMAPVIRLVMARHLVGVVMVVVDEQQRVLLLNHVFHPHVPWGPPGGWLDRAEAPAAGARRELWEETGLEVEPEHLLFARREDVPGQLLLAYAAQIPAIAPEELTLSSEIRSAAWFEVDDLPPLYGFARDAIELAISKVNSQPSTPELVDAHEH